MGKEKRRQHEGDRSDSSQMADEARSTASEVRKEAEEMGREAKHQVGSQLNKQKDRASEQLGSVSSALRSTSDDLREEDEETVAHYIEGAARQVDRLSAYLDENSVSDIYAEAEHYARREPSLFIGGAMLAGFLGARFLKSSSPNRGRSYGSRRSKMRQPERHRRRSYRSGPPSDRSHSRVHGTAGGEMPETEQEGSMSSSSPGDVPSARRQTPNMPHQATQRSSQKAAPSMPEESAADTKNKGGK